MAAGGVKVFAAGVAAAAAGVAALGTAAVKSYAEYEQLVGGIETLFGAGGATSVQEYADAVGKSVAEVQDEFDMLMEAQELALDNANNAYKTAGLSANEYMETVTSFAASLKASTANEVEAAEAANSAVIDMSDNANKMGTSMELIQNAYQGFAKQNYTMLDNLKLGYGGTKEEMQRLLADAEKLTGIKYDINNLSDVYSAIHVIQTELGITGTTAKEASTTISGSVNAMKASWSNLVTGIADDTQDFDSLVNNFVESAATAADNLLPRIEIAIKGIGTLIEKLLPVIADRIPDIINDVLPDLIQSGIGMINSLVEGVEQNLPQIMVTAGEIIDRLITAILEISPQLVEVAVQLIGTLAQGILDNLPQLVEAVAEITNTIINQLPNAIVEMLPQLIDMGMDLLVALIEGIAQALPELAISITNVITQIVTVLLEHVPDIVQAGIQLLLAIVQALPEVIDALADALPQIVEAIINALIEGIPLLIDGAIQLLNAIVDAIPQILESLINALPQIITTIIDGLIEGIPLLIEGAIQLFLAILEALPEIIDALIEACPQIIEAIIEGLTPLGEQLLELFSKAFDNLCAWFSDIGTSIKDFFINWWDSIVAFFTESIPAFFENIGTWLSELPEKIMYWLGYILTSIAAWNLDLITWVAENIPVLIDNIVTFFSELPGKIWDWLLDVIAKIIAWNVDMTTKAIKAGSDFVENVVSFIKNLPSRIWTWLLNTISKVASFIANFKQKATDAGKGFFDNIVSAIKDLPGKMAEIGGQIVSGIWTGISAGWDSLVSNVKNLANSLFQGAKDALEIHSPSKKFQWLGEMCVAGLDEPIADYDPYDTLDRTLKAGAKGVTASFAIAGAGQSKSIQQFDYERLGQEIAKASDGRPLIMDGRTVGKVVTPYVDEEMGIRNTRRT